MNQYWKLVYYEFGRLRNLYFTLLAGTLLLQVGGLIWHVQSRVSRIRETMEEQALTAVEYVQKFGYTGFDDYAERSMFFMGPIAFCIAALLLYVFLIWYRDWWGKNMFIYRLMMLPHSRMYLYSAKLSVILLSVLGLVGFQLILLSVQLNVYDWLMPDAFRQSMALNEVIMIHPLLEMLIPTTFLVFVLSYAAGAAGVILVFTAILMERSFRWKGIVAGIVYCITAVTVFLLPIIVYIPNEQYFYPIEVFWMLVGTGLLVTVISVWLSAYLLRNKVSV